MQPDLSPPIVEPETGWVARLRPLVVGLALPALIAVLFVAAVAEGRPLGQSAIICAPLFLLSLAWALWPLYGRSAEAAPVEDPANATAKPPPEPYDPVRASRDCLDDPRLGDTPDARRHTVMLYKGAFLFLVGVAILTLAVEHYTGSNSPVCLVTVSLPLLAVATAIYLRLRYRSPVLGDFASYKLAPVSPVLFVATLGLAAVEASHHFQHFGVLVLPGLLLAAPLVGLTAWLDGPMPIYGSKTRGVFALLLCLGFGPAALAEIDRDLDPSPARPFTATVLSKRISHSRRSTSYYVTISAWGELTAPDEVSVSSDLFDALPEGSRACIGWRPGALGAPWYDIATCRTQPIQAANPGQALPRSAKR